MEIIFNFSLKKSREYGLPVGMIPAWMVFEKLDFYKNLNIIMTITQLLYYCCFNMCEKWNCDDCEICLAPFSIVCDVHRTITYFPGAEYAYSETSETTYGALYKAYKMFDFAFAIDESDESDSRKEHKMHLEAQDRLKVWFDDAVLEMKDALLEDNYDLTLVSDRETISRSITITLHLRFQKKTAE